MTDLRQALLIAAEAKLKERNRGATTHCQCEACKNGNIHDSDCSVHNGDALPVGPCDCSLATLPVRPAESAESAQTFYQPAAAEAIKILKSLGYVYEPTYTGLAWVAKKSAQPEQQAEPVADGDKVICPACCHQFRAIPETVQTLMLHAGFEPPFTTAPKQQAEPVSQAVIAGALFDFMGWLTTRKERLILSSTDNASPAVESITEFAEMRGLSLTDARVQDWQNYTTSPRRKELSASEILDMMPSTIPAEYDGPLMEFARAVEAKLKERNK